MWYIETEGRDAVEKCGLCNMVEAQGKENFRDQP